MIGLSGRNGEKMNDINLFRLISSLGLIILIPLIGNLVTPASRASAPRPTPSPAPVPATPAPTTSPTPPPGGPTSVNFTRTQPNPYWQTYSRSDGLQNYDTTLLIDQAGRKWIGGTTGLAVFDGQTWQHYTSANGLLNDYVVALAQDLAGNIWVGYSGGGLSRLALNGDEKFDGHTWQHYTLALDMVGNSVRNLAVDPSGRLWFSAGYSLGMFDGHTWTLYQANPPLSGITSPPLEPPANAPLIKPQLIEIGPEHPAYFGMNDITVDAAGQIWLATRHGPAMFDGRQWSNYPLDIGNSHIAVDSVAGEVWMASGIGASRLTLPDPTEATGSQNQEHAGLNLSHYNQLNGLPRDSVEAIAIDPAGRVWFGTNAGATVFDGQTWQTYTQADGLPSGTITAIAVDPAGHLWLTTSGSKLSEFIPPAAPAPLPTPVSKVVPRLLDFTLAPTTALTVGDVISVTWQTVAEQAELCLFSGRPVYCQPVPVSGSRVITVDETLLTQAIGGVWLNVTAAGQSSGIFGELKFQCRYAWFFDSPSLGCPEAPPLYSRAAAQYFGHGLMIWTEQPDQFYVFFDENHQFARFDAEWVKEPGFLAPPEPPPMPTGIAPTPQPWPTAPPPSASEPVGGFGRVWQYSWRYENGLPVTVRQDIGWATGPEFEFETATQCALGTAAYHTWTCYVRNPTGVVLSYAPQSTVRDRWYWEEVTAP
jgi:hypothetical protein